MNSNWSLPPTNAVTCVLGAVCAIKPELLNPSQQHTIAMYSTSQATSYSHHCSRCTPAYTQPGIGHDLNSKPQPLHPYTPPNPFASSMRPNLKATVWTFIEGTAFALRLGIAFRKNKNRSAKSWSTSASRKLTQVMRIQLTLIWG